jgi:hypothetical protein
MASGGTENTALSLPPVDELAMDYTGFGPEQKPGVSQATEHTRHDQIKSKTDYYLRMDSHASIRMHTKIEINIS